VEPTGKTPDWKLTSNLPKMSTAAHPGYCATCGGSLELPEGYDRQFWIIANDNRGKHHMSCWQRPTVDRARVLDLEYMNSLLTQRCKELEGALGNIASIARREQDNPIGLHLTAFSLIEKYAKL
jgi:hypothetical protein